MSVVLLFAVDRRSEPCDDLATACQTYALWLRDSTEVTSKQLVSFLAVFFRFDQPAEV